MRRRGAGQPLAARAAGVADRHDLQVLGERVVDLAVARDDLPLQVGQVDERRRGQLVHARYQLRQHAGHDEVGPVPFERLHRGGGPGRTRDSVSLMSLPVRSGFCSEPDRANSFSMIF